MGIVLIVRVIRLRILLIRPCRLLRLSVHHIIPLHLCADCVCHFFCVFFSFSPSASFSCSFSFSFLVVCLLSVVCVSPSSSSSSCNSSLFSSNVSSECYPARVSSSVSASFVCACFLRTLYYYVSCLYYVCSSSVSSYVYHVFILICRALLVLPICLLLVLQFLLLLLMRPLSPFASSSHYLSSSPSSCVPSSTSCFVVSCLFRCYHHAPLPSSCDHSFVVVSFAYSSYSSLSTASS